MRNKGRASFWMFALSFAMGLGGNLHAYLPSLGYIAMLDLASYAVALPIILLKWNSMGKFMRRSLLFAFAWTAAAMLSNAIHFYQMKYWFKCVTVVSSSWAMMTATWFVMRKYPKAYLWYLVGAGVSAWISLHYFRNGAIEQFATKGGRDAGFTGTEHLIEKQIFPSIALCIFTGFMLPVFLWIKKMPGFLPIIGAIGTGFWLLFHGGSRSSFGTYCAAALTGALVLYGKRMFLRIGRSRFLVVVLALLGISVMFGAYKFMAKSGMMQEGEEAKFEAEFGSQGRGAIMGRAGLDKAIIDAVDSVFIGQGTHLRNHSVIANALACEGIVGFLFWIYFYLQVLWFVCRRVPYSGKYSAFIMVMLLSAAWAAFGSPFGTRHKFFVLMALIALCRDDPNYGVGTLFDAPARPKMPWGYGYEPA